MTGSTGTGEEIRVLQGLEPAEVMYYFEELSNLPRCSRNEEQASRFVVSFAEERDLEVHQDDMFNVLVKKPGTPGYENAPTVILHGHLDMVCKKEDGVEHDFLTQGVRLELDGDFVTAQGTTLGADNGLGIAYMLALLDSNGIPHPPLEAIMTVMEEMGKVGSDNVDTGLFSGKRMLDFNWIAEEQLLAGCSGDVSCEMRFPAEWETLEGGLVPMALNVGGLRGGHCEFDIHLERANSIVLLVRLLNGILDEKDVRIASVSGGVQNNVIPSEAQAVVLVEPADVDAVERSVEKTRSDIRDEYRLADPDIEITLTNDEAQVSRVLSKEAAETLTRSIALIPNGIQSWNLEIKGNWECSNNLGTMTTEADGITIVCTITSATTTRKHEVLKKLHLLAELAGNGVEAKQIGLDAPEFPYNEDSTMLDVCKKSYKKVMERDAEVLVAVCSLELGMFTERIPGLDTVGIGTELFDIHSPQERMNHKSVARVWTLIKEVMKRLDG